MMQRKHYNAIAAALRSGKASENLVWMIADRLKDDNISFNLGKFPGQGTGWSYNGTTRGEVSHSVIGLCSYATR